MLPVPLPNASTSGCGIFGKCEIWSGVHLLYFEWGHLRIHLSLRVQLRQRVKMRFVREADDDIAEKLDEDCDHRFRGCNDGFRCRGAGLRHAGYCD